MASVSSLGVGSGIDLQSLVDGLIASERQSKIGRLDARQAIATERISAYGLLRSSVSLFDASLSSLGNISTFQSRTTNSSDEDAFTVSAAVSASVGSYEVEVINAGESQSLTGTGFVDVTNTAISSSATAIGGGVLTIQQGNQPSFAVEISSAASSLDDIVVAINSAEGNTGVEAAVINADSGPVLVINSTATGVDNQVSITVADVDGNDTDALGLSQLTFDIADIPGSNLVQSTAADNAQITVNGQTITSTSGNTFSDVVSGVTITALTVTASAGTASITQNAQLAVTAVNDFVDSFNSLIGSVNELGRAGGEEGESSGVLVGDSVLRSLTGQLRRTIFTSVDDTQPEGVQSLSDIGISVDRDGALKLDSAKLNDLLESNFDDVARLLAADGNAIAQNQELQSVNFATVATVVGEGQLAISVGEESFNVAISASAGNNTLQGIRDAINAAPDNTGVTASVVLVDDGVGGTNAQLILTADEVGTESTITIVVTDNDANNTDLSGLSQLATENLSETVAASLDAPEGVIVRLQNVVEGFLGGSGVEGIIDSRTDGLNRDVERIGDERIVQESRLVSFQERLVSQYASLDLLVANLQSNGNFLLSQLSSISQISNNRNNN